MATPVVAVVIFWVVIFLALWSLLIWAMGWPIYRIASLSDLVPAYARYWKLLLVMCWQTLWRTVVGLVLAIGAGVLLGMIAGFWRKMRDALYPLPVGINAIQKATVVPIVVRLSVGWHDFNRVLMALALWGVVFYSIAVAVAVERDILAGQKRGPG